MRMTSGGFNGGNHLSWFRRQLRSRCHRSAPVAPDVGRCASLAWGIPLLYSAAAVIQGSPRCASGNGSHVSTDGASGGTRSPLPMLAFGVLVGVALALPNIVHARVKSPPIPSPSTFVFNEGGGVVVKSERAEVVRPIASLTKLMTAMVLLDAGADLERTVAYDQKRHYAYKNWMRFTRGDQLRGRDLFLATLVGSQNITARMLVEFTPYSEPEFVARMNEKAASLGLTQTRFVDVHGLSSKNVSTAPEVARLFDTALEHPDIADALSRSEVTIAWRTRRGKMQERLFHHTNTLVARRQRFATEASKTGYLDEAGDTIAMRIRDPRSGQRFTIVTLGEPRRYPRFAFAKQLAERAIRTSRIATAE